MFVESVDEKGWGHSRIHVWGNWDCKDDLKLFNWLSHWNDKEKKKFIVEGNHNEIWVKKQNKFRTVVSKFSSFFGYPIFEFNPVLVYYLTRGGRPATTISRPSHILLIFSSETPRNPRPSTIIRLYKVFKSGHVVLNALLHQSLSDTFQFRYKSIKNSWFNEYQSQYQSRYDSVCMNRYLSRKIQLNPSCYDWWDMGFPKLLSSSFLSLTSGIWFTHFLFWIGLWHFLLYYAEIYCKIQPVWRVFYLK